METAQVIGGYIVLIINIILRLYVWVIIGNMLLSWFMPPTHNVKKFFNFLTEPVIAPIRKLLEPLTRKSSIPLDLSPLVAVILINIILQIINQIV